MSRVEIPVPGDLVVDGAGNVLTGRAVTLTIAGTATVATHYSALSGGSSTTGGLVTHTDGTIVDGSGNRRYVDDGVALDLTIAGRTRQIEPLSASTSSGAPLNALSFTGMDRTGVANSATAMANAFAAAAGRSLLFPYGTYKSLSGLTLPAAGITLILDDAVLNFSGVAASSTLLTASGSIATAVNVNAVAFGATSITGSAGIETGINAGDVLKLRSTDVIDPGRTASTGGEQVTVLSTSSGTINLRSPVMGVYSTGVQIRKITRSPLKIRGSGQLTGGGSGSDHIGLSAKWSNGLRVDGLWFRACERASLQMWDCADFEVSNLDVDGSNNTTGYGVSVVNACQFGRVHHSHFRDCRHATSCNNSATDSGGTVRHVAFEDNEVRDSTTAGDAMDAHAANEYISWRRNTIFDAGNVGINVESAKATVEDNKIHRSGSHGIYLFNCAAKSAEYVCRGNKVYDSVEYGIRYGALTSGGSSAPTVLDIMDNTVVRAASGAIYVDPASEHRVVGARVNRNRAVACTSTGTSATIYVLKADASEVCDNLVMQQPTDKIGTRLNDFTRGKWSGNIVDFVSASTVRAHYGVLATDCSVVGNNQRNATGVGGKGLELDATSANCVVLGNGLRSATTPLTLNGITSHITTTADASGAYNKVA